MSKGTRDKDQFELDLDFAKLSDKVTRLTYKAVPCTAAVSPTYEINRTLIVAQATVRKERAERVLRSVGLLG